MKKLVVVFLCFFASNALASKPDSGICPWKLPFTMRITGIGNENWQSRSLLGSHSKEQDTESTISLVDSFVITLDTSSAYLNDSVNYSFNRDTLKFSKIFIDTSMLLTGVPQKPANSFESLEIIFDSAKSVITAIHVFKVDSSSTDNGWSTNSSVVYNLNFSSLLFDDSSIYTIDSSLASHQALLSEDGAVTSIVSTDPEDYYLYENWNFTASFVTLSGIFRTTTFSDPPSIVTEAPQPNNLAIYASNGSIACSFDVADYARDLEIFSPLGIREASFPIPAGQTGASLPHLPPGFYFVRLEGVMAKVYISN